MKLNQLVSIVIAGLLIVAFQNCADGLPDGVKMDGTLGSSTPTSVEPNRKNCNVLITSGRSWQVPADWNSDSNTIEAIGNGSDAGGNVRAGGGGGAYSKSVNVRLTPGNLVGYSVAHRPITLGAGTNSGDSYFCNSTLNCTSLTSAAVVVSAQGGRGSTNGANLDSAGGLGGSAAAGIATGPGALKFSGGNGGSCANATCDVGTAPGSGGGAAGPHGAGGNGGNAAGGLPDAGTTGGKSGAGGDAGAASVGGNGANYGAGAGGGADNLGGGIGAGGIIIINYLGTTCL